MVMRRAPDATVQHDGPNRALDSSGSEIHLSGVHNPWEKANISFVDVLLSLDSDFEVAVEPQKPRPRNVALVTQYSHFAPDARDTLILEQPAKASKSYCTL